MIASQDNNIPDEKMALKRAIASDRRWMGVGILGFVVILGVVGGVGWGYYATKNSNSNLQFTNNKTEIVAEIPNETQKPVAVVKPIFAVWNGSGVAGAAGKLADKLKAEGYEVVETKNAPEEQTGTTVEISSEMESQQEKIIEIVGVGVGPARPGLAGNLEYNVKVIIGK